MTKSRAWHLASRPQGLPNMTNFELKEVRLPELQEGWVRVENKWLSVDPYMRGRMNDVKSYVPPFQVGEPMDGGAVEAEGDEDTGDDGGAHPATPGGEGGDRR